MRVLALVLGLLLVIGGSFFALQGAGIIMWPADSFMLAEPRWTLYGALIALVGALLVWRGARRRG